jgi:hypothetical protein
VKVSLKIIEDNSKISNRIIKELRTQLLPVLTYAFTKSQQDITQLVQQAIVNSETYASLSNGQLKAEFGLPDSDNRLDGILNFWTNIYAKFDKPRISNNQISGGFKLGMIQKDFKDVLSLPEASFVTSKKDRLDWLEWLLLFGNKTIIKDYNISFGNYRTSRTGMAIMKGVSQGKWSVPSQYSGTINNNWITRVIDSLDQSIMLILEKNIKEAL